jgi:hypothetical protein
MDSYTEHMRVFPSKAKGLSLVDGFLKNCFVFAATYSLPIASARIGYNYYSIGHFILDDAIAHIATTTVFDYLLHIGRYNMATTNIQPDTTTRTSRF